MKSETIKQGSLFLIGALIFIAMTWRTAFPAKDAMRYQVSSFEYDPRQPVMDFYFIRYHHGGGLNLDYEKSARRNIASAADALDNLGEQGWHLIWSDGKIYLVERPAGVWRWDNFSLLPAATK